MTILDIELVHFGKFHHKKIKFSQGLNVVYGNNEAGKSTIHAFIHCMLLGMESQEPGSVHDFYDRYYPWEDRGNYSGKMRLEIDGHVYRIERKFEKSSPSLRLIDETITEELAQPELRLKELLGGLNETNYNNTISIDELKSSTEPELVAELEHFIVNTSRTKNVSVDMERAARRLSERSEVLRKRYLKDADAEYRACEEELRKAKKEFAHAREEQYRNERKHEDLELQIEEEQRQTAEAMLAYERERDSLCRQYEAARKNWEQAPQKKETKGNGMTFLFAVLAAVFAFGIGYLYLTKGFEEQLTVVAAAGFASALALCLIGIVVSICFAVKRKRQQKEEQELRSRLKKQYDDSVEKFDACKKSAPPDNQDKFDHMHQELVILKQNACEFRAQAQQWKETCEKLTMEQQEIRSRVADNRSIAQELEALEVAQETMEKVSTRVQETFGNRLCREAGVILGEVTKGKYERIQISHENGIRLGTSEKMYPLRSVSRGTMEQVYLSIRIAAANLLWQKSPMPFIFDDVFAYYDDERLESAMKLLKDCGHQVIIFSCNTREDQLLDAEG